MFKNKIVTLSLALLLISISVVDSVFAVEPDKRNESEICRDDLYDKLDLINEDFMKNLREYALMENVPSMELLIRSKTGVLDLASKLEEVCQQNINPSSKVKESYRVDSCRPIDSETGNISAIKMDTNVLKDLSVNCIAKAKGTIDTTENIIMAFVVWDANNKKTLAYANALQELAMTMRDINFDLSIVRGKVDKVIQGVNFLLKGKNASK